MVFIVEVGDGCKHLRRSSFPKIIDVLSVEIDSISGIHDLALQLDTGS